MLQSPLHEFHLEHGAQLVEYAGWQMPIRYSSITQEHEQTRTSGGLFDVSHMGRVKISGRHARRLLERLCTRDIASMQDGQCRYSLVCNEQGGIRDDVIVMRFEEDDYLVVVNAANREKLLDHFEQVRAAGDMVVKIDDTTMKTAMIALQGPKVMDLISSVSQEIPALKRYRFTVKNLMIMKLFVSRTGYTGEDGVEIILPANGVPMAMKLLLKGAGEASEIIKPCGLGCRDTLRLEAGMPLYGHELTEESNALGTGLDFAIALDKEGPFIGQDALKRTRDAGGPSRRLVGLSLEGRRTARQDMSVRRGDATIGVVTSGCLSPTLDRSIAMAYVDAEAAEPGGAVHVDAGRATLEGEIVKLPFYSRS
jgi:aminomethyltransferase